MPTIGSMVDSLPIGTAGQLDFLDVIWGRWSWDQILHMGAIKATSHELMVDYGPVTFELEAAHGFIALIQEM